ncbi:Profilin/allergen [Rhizopus microsporus var. microsporus]|uniref:Profilin n=2 Tax=Rhizopus microsporus TaxID=58291 RepID=A0A2G4SHL8_RHIZD|nr:Profilin/allergen [Rhizopus microsporus ATCC 52813]ORE09358.1 Profilin/allergen [Rhizopus microsporus var. microsporus]PHZ08265.1 Profilin/allergen [Rhizopus microsporus ATCC 52813]
MSWQAYVDTNLVGTGKVAQAAICGLEGGVWASSSGFQLQPSEIREIMEGFKNPDSVRANGLHIGNAKYFVIRADDKAIYIKKGNEGACIAKTGKAFLIGTYNDQMQPGQCNVVVEGLADYLISVGY